MAFSYKSILLCLAYLVLQQCLFAEVQSHDAVLQVDDARVSVTLSSDWQYAVPGNLVSANVVTVNGIEESFAQERAFYSKSQGLIDRVHQEAGFFDDLAMQSLMRNGTLYGQVEIMGNVYDYGADRSCTLISGAHPETNIIRPTDTGSMLIAGPESPEYPFRPSIHVSVNTNVPWVPHQKKAYEQTTIDPLTGNPTLHTGTGQKVTPRNTAELMTKQLAMTRNIYGDRMENISERKAVELDGQTFVFIEYAIQRLDRSVVQRRYLRKAGSRFVQIDCTWHTEDEREIVLQAIDGIHIEVISE